MTTASPNADTSVVDSIVRAYQGGASIRAVALEVGRSYGFVQGALTRAGVTMRRRGPAGSVTPHPVAAVTPPPKVPRERPAVPASPATPQTQSTTQTMTKETTMAKKDDKKKDKKADKKKAKKDKKKK